MVRILFSLIISFLSVSLLNAEYKSARREIKPAQSEVHFPRQHWMFSGDYPRVLQMMKEEKALNVNIRNHLGYTPLMYVSWFSKEEGAIPLAQELINRGADINEVNHGETPLTLAASDEGSAEMVRFLLDHGAKRGLEKALETAKDDYSFSADYLKKLDKDALVKVNLLQNALAEEINKRLHSKEL